MSKLNFLFFLLVTVFMVSCDPDKPVEPDPNVNPDSCFEFKDLDALFRNVTKVHFTTPNDGWVVGVSKENLAKNVLANTTDGGNTWTMVNEDLGILYNNQIVPGNPIQFLDANTGFQLIEKYSAGKLKLAYTHDKGATWTRFTNPDPSHYPRFTQGFSSNSTHTMFVGDVSEEPFYLVINHQTMEIESFNVVRSDQDNLDQFQILTKATGIHYSEDGVLTVVAQMQDSGQGLYQMVAMQTSDKGFHWNIRKEFDFTNELAGSWVDDNVAFVYGKQ